MREPRIRGRAGPLLLLCTLYLSSQIASVNAQSCGVADVSYEWHPERYPVDCPSDYCGDASASCATEVSCPDGYTACEHIPGYTSGCVPDGDSCPAVVCATVHTCADLASCRDRDVDCPSLPVCEPGWIRCSNGECQMSADDCAAIEDCADTQIRCGDWSCASDYSECPTTSVTCPPSYVMCGDGSCVFDTDLCPTPQVCPEERPFRCNDGSCSLNEGTCALSATCPASLGAAGWGDYPVMCSDRRCAKVIEDCDSVEDSACPTHLPYRCSDGSCVVDIADCPTRRYCPSGFVSCPDHTCASSLQNCRVYPDPEEIPSEVKCPDGTTAPSRMLCPSRPTCPASRPIMCWNQQCVDDEADCPQIFGDFDCKYPSSDPDFKDYSNLYVEAICTEVFDFETTGHSIVGYTVSGTGSGGMLEDPFSMMIDGVACEAQDFDTLRTLAFDNGLSTLTVRCPDGSCRGTWEDCPSMLVCPRDKPVRCADMSCAESSESCPENVGSCPEGEFRCPSGQCSADYCQPTVTCPPATPYLCPDESCRANPADCPKQTECPDGMFLCAHGRCVESLASCKQIGPPDGGEKGCQLDMIVRCPDAVIRDFTVGTIYECVENVGDCARVPASETYDFCPMTTDKVRGEDGFCDVTTNVGLHHKQCPQHLPHRCANGACAPDAESCARNDCFDPANPVLCPRNGRCCPSLTDAECCPAADPDDDGLCKKSGYESYAACEDGSCMPSAGDCQAAGECPVTFKRCNLWGRHDVGRCIASMCTDEDEPKRCTAEEPTVDELYPHGNLDSCVSDSQSCGFDDEALECLKPDLCVVPRHFRCNDGTCAESSQQCPEHVPTFSECEARGLVTCGNGYCGVSVEGCAVLDTLNRADEVADGADILVRCDDGTIRENDYECPSASTCPSGYIRCPESYRFNGDDWVSDDVACLSRPLIDASSNPDFSDVTVCTLAGEESSGEDECCTLTGGLCVADISECRVLSSGCPLSAPIRCDTDGTCVDDVADCPAAAVTNGGCGAGLSKCANGMCVNDIYTDCPTSEGCFLPTPYRCENGTCAANEAACPASVDCYMCGETTQCEPDPTDCLASNGCDPATPVRCTDGTCAASGDDCELRIVCPTDIPYVCADGTCVADPSFCRPMFQTNSSLVDPVLCPDMTYHDGSCPESANRCPTTTPVRCRDGSCVPYATDCREHRMFDEWAYCPENKFRCFDGFCVDSPAECSARADAVIGLSTCPDGMIRCNDGTCSSDVDLCPSVVEGCAPGYRRCADGTCIAAGQQCGSFDDSEGNCWVDGLCRPSLWVIETPESGEEVILPEATGPAYDGCALDAPVRCPSGSCITSEQYAADGFEACEVQCADDGASSCHSPAWDVKAAAVEISVNPQATRDVVLSAVDGQRIGTLTLVSGAFGLASTVRISEAADSDLVLGTHPLGYPLARYMISPPLFMEVNPDETDLSLAPSFSLSLITKIREGGSVDDICLGTAEWLGNETRWDCDDRTLEEVARYADGYVEYRAWAKAVNGFVALIDNPIPPPYARPAALLLKINPNEFSFWQQYTTLILSITVACIMLFGVVIYILLRLYRYRKKWLAIKNQTGQKSEDDDLELTVNPMLDPGAAGSTDLTEEEKRALALKEKEVSEMRRLNEAEMKEAEARRRDKHQLEAQANEFIKTFEDENKALQAEIDRLRAQQTM